MGGFSGRNDIVDKFCRYPLLIIDDFGTTLHPFGF